jgi:predicted acetyltransferase
MELELEVPSLKRKEEAIEFINEFYDYNSQINGTGGLQRYLDNYEGWLKKLEAEYVRIPNEEQVPRRTYFLIRKSDNKIIGMINIRLALNKKLIYYGGSIGYSIRPTERRKGYAKINLYLGLKKCKEYGIKEVIVGCNKDNLGSARTIQSLGGILNKEMFYEPENRIVQDYIIDVDKSIEKYKDIYENS